MDLDRFLNLLATLFGAVGSLYVLKGLIELSPDLMERLSRTYYDFSAPQIASLAGQKADSIVGVVLVILALVIGVVNIALVPSGVKTFEGRGVAVALALALASTSYITLLFAGTAIKNQQRLEVGKIITSQQLGEWFQRGKLSLSDVPSLQVYARTLLDMTVEDSETPRSLLRRVAQVVGREIPANFDFSEVERQ